VDTAGLGDVCLVPVTLSYGAVPEARRHAAELLGRPKRPESLAALAAAAPRLLLAPDPARLHPVTRPLDRTCRARRPC
jgi:hypothetical protein